MARGMLWETGTMENHDHVCHECKSEVRWVGRHRLDLHRIVVFLGVCSCAGMITRKAVRLAGAPA